MPSAATKTSRSPRYLTSPRGLSALAGTRPAGGEEGLGSPSPATVKRCFAERRGALLLCCGCKLQPRIPPLPHSAFTPTGSPCSGEMLRAADVFRTEYIMPGILFKGHSKDNRMARHKVRFMEKKSDKHSTLRSESWVVFF